MNYKRRIREEKKKGNEKKGEGEGGSRREEEEKKKGANWLGGRGRETLVGWVGYDLKELGKR